MDAKNIIYGETALDRLVQALRASGQPQEIAKLTERYLEILRDMVLGSEQPTPPSAS
jgi:DNA-binding NarL/FixJ family response regulator